MLRGSNAEAMMKHVVFVDGQEGTTGLRIHEYLAQRGDVEVLNIDPDRRKDAAERARLLNAADVGFLCLPDDAAREAAAMVHNPRTCLIDASTAHRTVPGWVFGLPELALEPSASPTRAAMPAPSSCCCARWSMPASCRRRCRYRRPRSPAIPAAARR
jgi:N-acetyl-gamma-glutamyl-phosphate reductase